MANSKILVPFIKSWEGGFVNDPDDAGGATNQGITLTTYRSWYEHEYGYPISSIDALSHLKSISDNEWHDIFKEQFWDRFQADKIVSQPVANILVDWLWASGPKIIKRVQRLLGVDADGIVGPRTLAAINSTSDLTLFVKLKKDRAAYINEICRTRKANLKFRQGWLNRLYSITYLKLTCNGEQR